MHRAEVLPKLSHSGRFFSSGRLCQLRFGSGCAVAFKRVEFLHVVLFTAGCDPNGESEKALGAVADSSHCCVSGSGPSPHHWIADIFSVPW